MERSGHIDLEPEVRDRLLRVSASTIDRLLAPVRRQAKGRKRKNEPKKVSKQISVRTSSDRAGPKPGELETDMVLHCGSSISGMYLHSPAATDVCSGWTEAVPLLAREQSLAAEGLDVIWANFPIPAIGFNSDDDSAFASDPLLAYCEENGLVFTRSRPYQKNDQAWIGKKNGAFVRRFGGYQRFSGMVAGQLLGQLYQAARSCVNYFQPSFKLREKIRDGSKVKMRCYPPATPADRLLRSDLVSDGVKRSLRKERSRPDSLALLHGIREVGAAPASIASPESMERPGESDLDAFLAQLPKLWESGEVRPTHRKPRGKTRNHRTREDPFEKVWPDILLWLSEDPDATAKSLFLRLQDIYPGHFNDGQLRTLQRRVKERRCVMARELVYGCYYGTDDDNLVLARRQAGETHLAIAYSGAKSSVAW
ncbi:MAG: integrase catalytic domain-containing protein [Actinomycetota bacterium]